MQFDVVNICQVYFGFDLKIMRMYILFVMCTVDGTEMEQDCG